MNATIATEARWPGSLQRFVRRFPIDWQSVAEESGCTKGTLAHNEMFGWHIRDGNGPATFCMITPPEVGDGETLRIEGRDWCVYSANVKVSDAPDNAAPNRKTTL